MTDGTVRTARHTADEAVVSAKAALAGVPDLLKGRPGFSADEQIERLSGARDLLDEAADALYGAVESLDEALEVVEARAADADVEEEDVEVDSDPKAALTAALKALSAAVAAL